MCEDIIIPVIGLTGVGKSKFINTAAGRDVARVGHGLYPCTADIQIIQVPDPRIGHRRIIFIDTPGFDHTHISNKEILESIRKTLKDMYNDNQRLAGILYLWDISRARENAIHNLDIFCGSAPLSGVVVATMQWSNPPTEDETNRQTELRSKNLDVVQFTGERDSAWHIIDRIIQQEAFDVRALVESLKGYSQKRRDVAGAILALFKKILLRHLGYR